MVEGVFVMLPVPSVHVVPFVIADECPLSLKNSGNIPKKKENRGTASAMPKYGDNEQGLPVQSTQLVSIFGNNVI